MNMEIYDVIVRFFQTGGPFMYPIAVVLAIGLAIALERWLVLTSAKHANRRAFDVVMAHLRERNYKSVMAAGSDSKVPMYRIVAVERPRSNLRFVHGFHGISQGVIR